MADKATKTEAKAPENTAQASYTMEEFARNAQKTFGEKANADIVFAAFKVNGKTTATLSEATDIVSKFLSKEVK